MNRTSVIACCSALLLGCGQPSTPPEQATKVEIRLPTDLAIIEKSLDEPLTSDEVLCFIELVKALPDGKPPVFSSIPGHAAVEGRSPEESVKAWRKNVRKSLTVNTLMQGWSPRSHVRGALIEHRISPRSLSSLMLRLSCALAAEGMGGSQMVSGQRLITDQKVEVLITRIHQCERSRTPVPESLWQALEEAASLAEYLDILSNVPIESQQLVAEHQIELKRMLPPSSKATAPLETREDNRITPISFEKPILKNQSQRR